MIATKCFFCNLAYSVLLGYSLVLSSNASAQWRDGDGSYSDPEFVKFVDSQGDGMYREIGQTWDTTMRLYDDIGNLLLDSNGDLETDDTLVPIGGRKEHRQFSGVIQRGHLLDDGNMVGHFGEDARIVIEVFVKKDLNGEFKQFRNYLEYHTATLRGYGAGAGDEVSKWVSNDTVCKLLGDPAGNFIVEMESSADNTFDPTSPSYTAEKFQRVTVDLLCELNGILGNGLWSIDLDRSGILVGPEYCLSQSGEYAIFPGCSGTTIAVDPNLPRYGSRLDWIFDIIDANEFLGIAASAWQQVPASVISYTQEEIDTFLVK